MVLDWLVELAADGGAVLMSTHTLQAIDRVAKDVTVIRQGRAVFQGLCTSYVRIKISNNAFSI